MHWSKLIDLSENSSIKRHNRLFTNWFRVKRSLENSRISFEVHRIGSKRVVLEVFHEVTPGGRGRRTWAVPLALVSLLSLFLGFSWLAPTLNQTAAPSANSVLQSAENCSALTFGKPFDVTDLSKFELGDWIVTTFGDQQTIGGFTSVEFEATCEVQIQTGELTAVASELGFTILRMKNAVTNLDLR